MNPNDDREREVDQKDIDEGLKASKRNEAKRRLIAQQGEVILEDPNLEKLITEEVKRMDELAAVPQPTVKEHNVHESILNTPDNTAGVGKVPGKASDAQNTQEQDVKPKSSQVPKDKTDIKAKQTPDVDQQKRTARANQVS
jgi:hypothetical protein